MAYTGEKDEEGKDGKKYLLDYADWNNDPEAELKAYYHIVYGFKVSTSWKRVTQNKQFSCLVPEKQFVEFELLIEVANYDPKRSQIYCELKFQVGDQWHKLIAKDKQELPDKRYGKESEPRKLVWNFKPDQIPKEATRAEATVWHDPYGGQSILMPDKLGLKLETWRHKPNANEG